MSSVTLLFYLSAFLFASGILVVITKKNAIMILIGIELMLNAANLNLVLFNRTQHFDGQFFALFVILIAVCEASVGIAIILKAYHFFETSVPNEMKELKEKN